MISPFITALFLASQPLTIHGSTDPVKTDADDPAIWVHSTDGSRSLILGTDKDEEDGGVYVFNLDGKIVQAITGLKRPNNVDVEYGWAGQDIAVVTERLERRLRIFSIDRSAGRLSDISGSTEVFKGREGEAGAPMGVALYKRPKDGAVFAIVGSKTGPLHGYLHQYRLKNNAGRADLEFVRAFGTFGGLNAEGEGEIEALFVDDERGWVYLCDELTGIRRFSADPERPSPELLFGTSGYEGDREGVALWKDMLLSTDQIEGSSALVVYPRDLSGSPRPIARLSIPADDTDGIEATGRPLGPKFPEGLIVAMNSKGKNFLFFDPRELRERIAERP